MADEPSGVEEVREQLRAVLERIDDLVIDQLREAVGRGDKSRPELERRLTRARGGVARALGALGDNDADPGIDD